MDINVRSRIIDQLRRRPNKTPELEKAYKLVQDQSAWEATKSSRDYSDLNARLYLIYNMDLQELRDNSDFIAKIANDQGEDETVRAAAVTQLGLAKAEQHIDMLIHILQDRQSSALLQSEIAYALGFFSSAICSRKAIRTLMDVLGNDFYPSNVRARAAESLGSLGRKSSVPRLISALSSPSAEIRFFAARALGWIHDHRALDPLRTILASDDGCVEGLGSEGYWVRDEAANAIDNIMASTKRISRATAHPPFSS